MRIKLKNKEIDVVSRDEMKMICGEISLYLDQIDSRVSKISANQRSLAYNDWKRGSAM